MNLAKLFAIHYDIQQHYKGKPHEREVWEQLLMNELRKALDIDTFIRKTES